MKFGLLGESISYSFSPLIHEMLGSKPYLLIEKNREEVDKFLAKKEFQGINVTIPYKERAMAFCDKLDKSAQRIGNVNTILNDNGVLTGYNTDYYGFVYSLKSMELDIEELSCLVVGDGAVSKTVKIALEDLGVKEILQVARKSEHNFNDISYYENCNLLINCTPIGNNLHLDIEFPIELNNMKDLKYVIDLNYNPIETQLLSDAKKLGCKTTSGLTMLVAQARKASELFQKKEIDESEIGVVVERMHRMIKDK